MNFIVHTLAWWKYNCSFDDTLQATIQNFHYEYPFLPFLELMIFIPICSPPLAPPAPFAMFLRKSILKITSRHIAFWLQPVNCREWTIIRILMFIFYVCRRFFTTIKSYVLCLMSYVHRSQVESFSHLTTEATYLWEHGLNGWQYFLTNKHLNTYSFSYYRIYLYEYNSRGSTVKTLHFRVTAILFGMVLLNISTLLKPPGDKFPDVLNPRWPPSK